LRPWLAVLLNEKNLCQYLVMDKEMEEAYRKVAFDLVSKMRLRKDNFSRCRELVIRNLDHYFLKTVEEAGTTDKERAEFLSSELRSYTMIRRKIGINNGNSHRRKE
jgi:hypothetical protein